MPGPGQQVGHQVEQPGQPVARTSRRAAARGRPGHRRTARRRPARRAGRRSPCSRCDDRLAHLRRVRAPARRRRSRRASRRARPGRRSAAPAGRRPGPGGTPRPSGAARRPGPARTSTVARPVRSTGPDQRATWLIRSTSAGGVVRARAADRAGPRRRSGTAGSSGSASRSRSWPTTYHRPRQQTTPHGCSRAGWRGVVRRARGSRSVTARRSRAAAVSGANAGSTVTTGSTPERGLRVDVDAGGAQLGQPGRRGRGQPGVLPQPGRDADRGRLVRLEGDVGQRVLAAGDPVAGLGVEDAGRAGLQRHARARAARPCPARTCAGTPRGRAGRPGRARSRARSRRSARRSGTVAWTAGRSPG